MKLCDNIKHMIMLILSIIMFVAEGHSLPKVVRTDGLWSNSSVDSIIVDFRYITPERHPTLRIMVCPSGVYCEFAQTKLNWFFGDYSDDLLKRDDKAMLTRTSSWTNQHLLDEHIGQMLNCLIDSLYISRNVNIIENYTPTDGIVCFEPSCWVDIRIFRNAPIFSVEMFSDSMSSCWKRGKKLHEEGVCIYSSTYYDFQLLLHYIAICEGVVFFNQDEIKNEIKNRFPFLMFN